MKQQEIAIIEVTVCAHCGIHFGAPEDYLNARRADGAGFCCPNGHRLAFGGDTNKQLKADLEKAQREAADAKRKAEMYQNWYSAEISDHAETRTKLRSTRGQLTKTKKRVAKGVCPCCNRTFKDLARHMAGQHPEFAKEEEEQSK